MALPMPIDVENTEPWMVEDSYWTPSADLLVEITDSYERDDSLIYRLILENTISNQMDNNYSKRCWKINDWVTDNSDEE